jgi:hypothetical protein
MSELEPPMTYANYCDECAAVGFTPMSEHNWNLMTMGIPRRPLFLTLERIKPADASDLQTAKQEDDWL